MINIYSSWKDYLFDTVHLRNAWNTELEYIDRKNLKFGRESYAQLEEYISAHSNFLKFYIDNITSEKLFALWSDVYKIIKEYSEDGEIYTEYEEKEFEKKFKELLNL